MMFTMIAAVLLVSFDPVALKAGEEPDSVRNTVVFLGKKDPSGKGIKPVGTGFLLASEKGVCLITARHVAKALASDAPITLMLGEQTRTLELTEISSTSPPNWVFAEKADVAALKVKPPPEAPLHVFRRAQVLTSATTPTRERPVTVFGFPLGLGASAFSPVSQTYYRASDIVLVTSDAFPMPAEYYLLDRPSIEGYSGSPVFQIPGHFSRGSAIVIRRDFALVGLMVGTVSDKTGGKLAAVVPSKYIADLFDRVVTEKS